MCVIVALAATSPRKNDVRPRLLSSANERSVAAQRRIEKRRNRIIGLATEGTLIGGFGGGAARNGIP